jgi:hypothetical protein
MSTGPNAVGRRNARRGRPPKYGRPAKVVALTLPAEIVERLQRVHSDLGWAVVSLAEKSTRFEPARHDTADAQLVEVGGGQSLIVVNSARFHALAGVDMVPLSATQAFLALEPGKGMADLELAVIDRIDTLPAGDERQAWIRLRDRLRRWRQDRRLRFDNRSIIIVTRAGAGGRDAT